MMNVEQLVKRLEHLQATHPNNSVGIDFGDGVIRGIGRVSELSGTEPPDTIIERGANYQTIAGMLALLRSHDPRGKVQLFTADTDDYAYYKLRNATLRQGILRLDAGTFINGGI